VGSPSVPGFRLGNYQLVLELASGGMGTVHVARHLGAAGFERLVVVKRVHPHLLGNREFSDMFRDEARVAALIRHPNVVSVSDVVELEGELFLVMEYCESHALSTMLKSARTLLQQPLPIAITLRIFADMLAGLNAAHEAKDMMGQPLHVVHRDVSPQNIIVGIDGVTRLIDFGVAKAARRLTETRSGSLKGKLAYMSPEQARGVPLDRRADLFATGATLHEALTGVRLFKGENEADTLGKLLHSPIPAPSAVESTVSSELDRVTLKALARDPEKRYQTAADFLEDLEHAAQAASPREVAECLDHLCGERTLSRREELQTLLDELSRKTKLRPQSLSSGSPDDELMPTPATPRPQRGWVLPVALGAGLAFAGGAGIALWRTTSPDEPDSGTAGVGRDAARAGRDAAASGSARDASADLVVLTLSGPNPIAAVRTTGLEWARLNGTFAEVAVRPWEGDLPVEVILEDGRSVRTVAPAKGSRELKLELAASTDASRRGPRPTPHPGQNDLHENPYDEH
jgi:serine/threonine-protein kinase